MSDLFLCPFFKPSECGWLCELRQKAHEAKENGVRMMPEQTCSIVGEEYDDLLEYTSVEFSCGHYAIGLPQYFNYCPKCGAKVVGE